MPILNYSTTIDADKTAGEISKMLSLAGAKAVLTEYNQEDNFVEAISFRMDVDGKDIGFRLPTDWKPVLDILENDKKVPRRMCDREQAVKVAWRIVKDWVEAQLAIIETKMVKPEEVFLPYAIMKNGQTLFDNNVDGKFLLE